MKSRRIFFLYQNIGFALCWSKGGLALLHYGLHGVHGGPAFLLQNYYVKKFAENLPMHLLARLAYTRR